MTLQRARSVDELYAETQDYDLVLTTDGPLSLALNRRLDRPRLGRFAATPRMLASGEFVPHDERPLFIELVTETDLSWKHASYLVDNILRSWEETGEIDAILGFDRYDTAATREAIEVIEQAGSSHGDLTDYTIADDLDVAVIGEEQFTTLDCTILPAEYDTISSFASNTFDLPEFCLFDSATAIVETVVDATSRENAEDIAVVMDRGSEYPALVESAFESADIPYCGGPGFVDDTRVRVVKDARIDDISDTPNFQALLYLAQHRDERPNERLEFRFFHFLETLDDAITGDEPPSLDDGITTLTYYPTSFEEHIQREATFEVLREDDSNKCQKTFEQVEYETYRTLLNEHDVPQTVGTRITGR